RLFFLLLRRPLTSTLFPYTTLFRSLAIFLLVICGAIVFTAPRPFRLFSYGLFVAAGLLKYYPLVLLILVARERRRDARVTAAVRSEEHTSELQSPCNLVCRLLLEKK